VGIATAVLLALAPTACRRDSGPSADYEEASRRFRTLYAQKLDEAYLDPQMGEIEAQLQRVPADSLDAEGARALLQRIQEGRARLRQEASAREKAVAAARELPPGTSLPGPTPEPRAPPPPVEPPDAGPPDAGLTGPQVGTPASELVAGFRGCFRRGAPLEVEARGVRETWELADRTSCRLEYPGHGDVLLVIEEGRVLTLLPKSAVRTVTVTADGGTVPPPAPDAGR
jgi:hypothetical protein